jgi:hypothetical protein
MTAAPHRLAEQLARLDLVELAAVVSLLPVEMLLAVRVGLEVASARADAQLAARLAEDYTGIWHREHPLTEVRQLDRRRFPPDGDRERWIRNGPPGHTNYTPRKAA